MLAWAYQLYFDFDFTHQSHFEQTLESNKEGSPYKVFFWTWTSVGFGMGTCWTHSRTQFVLQCRCVFRRCGWPWPCKNFISQNFSIDVLVSGFASLKAPGSWRNTLKLLLTMVFPAVIYPLGFAATGSAPCQRNTWRPPSKLRKTLPQQNVMWQASLKLETYQLSHW